MAAVDLALLKLAAAQVVLVVVVMVDHLKPLDRQIPAAAVVVVKTLHQQ